MLDVAKMMAIVFVMPDGWELIVKMYAQKVGIGCNLLHLKWFSLKILVNNQDSTGSIAWNSVHVHHHFSCVMLLTVAYAVLDIAERTVQRQKIKLNSSMVCHQIDLFNNWNLKPNILLFYLVTGQSSASIAWGVIVALLLVGFIIVLSLIHRRRVRNLKTEIAHVQYIADPHPQPDRHHFDNPVYAFQPSTSTSTSIAASDSSTLLNNLRSNHKPSNLSRGNAFFLFGSFQIYALQC